MRVWLFTHFSMATIEAALLFVAAAAMVAVVYVLRDSLADLSHPWVRRLGWRRGLIFLLVPAVPFWSTTVGFALIPAFFAMAAFQVERLWFMRAIGGDAYLVVVRRAAAASSRRAAIVSNLGGASLLVLAAGALWLMEPDPAQDWGFWFAVGLALYGLLNGYDRARAALRVFDQLSRGAT